MCRRPSLALAACLLLLPLVAPEIVLGADPPANPPPRKKAAPAPAPKNELKVMSADLEKRNRPKSQFLAPPGASRYDSDDNDWREIPAWRQTSFYGIRAKGQVFIYVVDCSGSMIDEDRLIRAKAELRRTIMSLKEPQRFKVIFYNHEMIPMPGDLPLAADWDSKERLLNWLRLIEPDGETDPRGAMSLALSLRPDAVFLLSDGAFPDGTAEAIAKKNSRKIPIHGIDLSGGEGGDHLMRIARDSGGQYKARAQPSLTAP